MSVTLVFAAIIAGFATVALSFLRVTFSLPCAPLIASRVTARITVLLTFRRMRPRAGLIGA
jgi:hypothetical protein